MGISIPNLNLPCLYRLETSEKRGKLSARKKIGKESNDELSQAKGKVSIDNYHLFCRTQERKVSFPRAGGIAKGKKKENTFFEVKYFFSLRLPCLRHPRLLIPRPQRVVPIQ